MATSVTTHVVTWDGVGIYGAENGLFICPSRLEGLDPLCFAYKRTSYDKYGNDKHVISGLRLSHHMTLIFANVK